MFFQILENIFKKYSVSSNSKCKCCPLAGKEQLHCDNNNSIFCKISNVVYYIECSTCNLGCVVQASNTLNVRINGQRSNSKSFKIKKLMTFELNIFNCMILIKWIFMSLKYFKIQILD